MDTMSFWKSTIQNKIQYWYYYCHETKKALPKKSPGKEPWQCYSSDINAIHSLFPSSTPTTDLHKVLSCAQNGKLCV